MFLAKSLPRWDTLPRPNSRVKNPRKKPPPEPVLRGKHLMNSVHLGEGQARVLVGACGVPIELPGGGHMLKASVISESYWSRMLSGGVPFPAYRLGELAAVCEYAAAIRLMQIRSGHPDAEFFAALLKTFPNALGWFMRKPEYRIWIERFRYAIFNRVKLDRKKSAYDETIYRTYNEYLKKADGQMDAETPNEKAEEAAENAELQAATE